MERSAKDNVLPRRIAVIGGGITGLAAAHRIRELLPQADLTLYEKSPRLGGVLETMHRDGFLIERSADNFLTRLPEAVSLCRRLGIERDLISTDETRRRAFVVSRGRLLPIPDGYFLMEPRRLGPVLRSPILSPAGKLRMLMEPLIPRGPASRNLAADPPIDHRADESVAAFARRRFGREVFERLIQPLVAGIYTADPEKLSMAATMPQFLAHERERGSLLVANRGRARTADAGESASGARYSLFVTLRNGMSSLVDALAAALPQSTLKIGTSVDQVAFTAAGQWYVTLNEPASPAVGDEPDEHFDAVIIATPAHVAAQLLRRHDSALADELAAIEYAGCAVVSLVYKREQIAHSLDGFGFVVPSIEERRIIAASFASQKFTGRAPRDAAVIRVFIGGALQPQLVELPDNELRRIAIDELHGLLGIAGQPLFVDIARWPRSMPQYHVGHLDRVAHLERRARRYPTLVLAGNAYHGVGIPQCIASAESAAERVIDSIHGQTGA